MFDYVRTQAILFFKTCLFLKAGCSITIPDYTNPILYTQKVRFAKVITYLARLYFIDK